VGSGLSAWSGLPTWRRLLEELAAFRDALGLSSDLVRREIAGSDLLQAASYGFMGLTPAVRREFLQQVCQFGAAEPSDAHRALMELPPTCFITTNYDTLLEQALIKYRPGTVYRIVTNRQPIDQPSLLLSTSFRFVFKPHGDIMDTESIVLTREDYRRLASTRGYTLQSMRTLLVTRPVLFIGFGLRDPDFLMIRDALVADYLGGTADQFALVRTPHVDEVRYWREQYGIQLIGYRGPSDTTEHPHGAMLDLLHDLGQCNVGVLHEPVASDQSVSSNDALALLRLAARVRKTTDSVAPAEQIPLRLTAVSTAVGEFAPATRTLNDRQYDVALRAFSGALFVFGPPGAGKTFGALRYLRELADRLTAVCIAEDPSWQDIEVPVMVPLRLYGGDILRLVQQQMSAELSMTTLMERGQLVIVLDGINEVPSQYLSSNQFWEDAAFIIEGHPGARVRVLMLGRAPHDAAGVVIPTYELDAIDDAWLRQRIDLSMQPEVLDVIARPFLYRMYADGLVNLQEVRIPVHVYRQYFDWLIARIEPAELAEGALSAMGALAFDLLADGELTLPFGVAVSRLGRRHASAESLATCLIRLGFLVPEVDSRVSCLHQSLLEYLAAVELVARESAFPGLAGELARRRIWDYVVLLAASLAPQALQTEIVTQLLRVDLVVAIRAILYSDQVDGAVVETAIQFIRDNCPDDWPSVWSLVIDAVRLPVSERHEPSIRALLQQSSTSVSVGVGLLLSLNGRSVAREAVGIMISHGGDYNLCTDIARRIAPFANRDLLDYVLDSFDELETASEIRWQYGQRDPDRVAESLLSATAELLSRVSPDVVFDAIDVEQAEGARLALVTNWLWTHRSVPGWKAVVALIRRGNASAVFPFEQYVSFPSGVQIDHSLIDAHVANTLASHLDGEEKNWAARALLELSDLSVVREVAARELPRVSGTVAVILQVVVAGSVDAAVDVVVNAFDGALNGNDSAWELLGSLDIDWLALPELFDRIIRSGNVLGIETVTEFLMEDDWPSLDVEDADWWLSYVTHVSAQSALAGHRLGGLVGRSAQLEQQRRIVRSMVRMGTDDQLFIAEEVLPFLSQVSTDDVPDQILSLLLDHEVKSGFYSPEGSVIGSLATEHFVDRVLIPAWTNVTSMSARRTIGRILERAGRRHGRRYIGSDGRLLG